jgi:hypothetical protein
MILNTSLELHLVSFSFAIGIIHVWLKHEFMQQNLQDSFG